MEKRQTPRHALVLVRDGRKALFLHNAGDEVFPDLKVVRVLADKPSPPTHLQGTDKPGRTWIAPVVATAQWNRPPGIFLPKPTSRGRSAKRSKNGPRPVIGVAEHHKDLTKHPAHEIERLLSAS